MTFLTVEVFVESAWASRGGNYIYRRLVETLLREGHSVYVCSIFKYTSSSQKSKESPYSWKSLFSKDKDKPLSLVEKEAVLDLLPSVDFVIWALNPDFTRGHESLVHEIKIRKKPFIYLVADCWESAYKALDPNGHIPPSNEYLPRENFLIHSSDYLFCVSPQLCSLISVRTDKKVYWLPNASVPFPLGRTEKKRQIALIVSSVFPCRGVERIFSLASSFPDWTFLWVGSHFETWSPLYSYPFKRFFFPPNVRFLGERDNFYLTFLSEGASVGIVMAGRYHFSYYADPTKWYVYHNLGLPVVSFYTPHHEQFPDFYPYTFTGTDVVSTFRKAIENLPENVRPLPIHTWEHRVKVFLSVLSGDGTGYGYALRGVFHPTYHNYL